MALTQTQASDEYVIASFAQFLYRNVVTPYNTAVSPTSGSESLDISKPLQVLEGKPSDSNVGLNPPVIAIDDSNGGSAVSFEEVGSTLGWRTLVLTLYCFPAVNAVDGEPNSHAAYLLKSYMRNVLQTVSFKMIDYSNVACTQESPVYCGDNCYIMKFTTPINRGKNMTNAAERNRFDITVHLSYPVNETLVS